MDIVTILVWVCLAIIVISLLMMLGFGLKNSSHRLGGESKLALAALALPVVILLVVYAISNSWTEAAVMTAVITALAGFLALIVSGARSLFS